MHVRTHTHNTTGADKTHTKAHTEKNSQYTGEPPVLLSVLVELVQFAPADTEEVDRLLDSLALQRSSTRHHLLPVSQYSIDRTSQLVNIPLYVLRVWRIRLW